MSTPVSPPISLPTTSPPSSTPSPPVTTPPPPSSTSSSSSSSTVVPPSSSSSSSSSSTSLAASTTSAPVVPTTTTARASTTSTTGPAILTQTSTRFISSSTDGAQPTNNADTGSSSKGFFSNTGAVAGVFSVVGLIGLALIIALITNGIRRRRARKFDKELAAATLEAASAPKPVFLDDDDDDPYRSGGGAGSMAYNNTGGYGAGGFSDASSHGTFSQPPMSVTSHGGEAYGMREMGSVGPGEIYGGGAAGGGAAGAAGIGVARARSMRADGGYAAGLQDGAAPYAAFAVPTQQHDPYASQPQLKGVGRDTNTNADILEAAGMGAHVAGAGVLSRGQSQYKNAYNSQYQPYPSQAQPQYGGLHQRSPSQLQQAQELEYANLNKGKSMGSREGHGGAPPMSAASNATSNATQYYSPAAESYQSNPYTQGGQQNPPPHAVAEEDMDDAYGGYVAGGGGAVGGAAAVASPVSAKSGLPNPFEAGSSTGHGKQEYDDRESRYSDEEEEAPKRVLKVANE